MPDDRLCPSLLALLIALLIAMLAARSCPADPVPAPRASRTFDAR